MKPLRPLVAWLVLPLVAVAGNAHAQSASDKAAAEALFQEGRKLFDAGQYPAACAKLLESERLDPAPGTLLNLGGCYQKNGQTASAWVTFKEAVSASHQKGRADWEDLARARAAALEPTLSRLTVTVTAPTIDGLKVSRDTVAVGQAEWGTAIPVDPGSHVIDAQAPGRAPFHQAVDVAGAGANVSVSVPDLAAGDSTVPGTGDESKSGSAQRTIGLIIAGAGVVGIGLGAAFGFIAMGKENDALHNDCTADKYCNSTGVQLGQDAHSAATISTIGFAVGAVAVAGGLTLFFLAPKDTTSAPTVGLRAASTPGGATVGLTGTW